MRDRILITGGAGFVGSHLADLLLERGYRVRALDNLTPQVHGSGGARPAYLATDVSLARSVLDFQPQVSLEEGMAELAEWLAGEVVAEDCVDAARAELADRGLAR